MRWFSLLLLVLAVVAGCSSTPAESPAAAQPPAFKPVVPLNVLMEATVTPASYAIFDAAVYNNGVLESAPKTDEEWEQVEHGALTLAESANLLLLPGRAMPGEEWTRWTHALSDAALAAARAAESKNIDAIMDAGGQVYDTCQGCHARYLVEAQNARIKKSK
jgi:hypothetical protein